MRVPNPYAKRAKGSLIIRTICNAQLGLSDTKIPEALYNVFANNEWCIIEQEADVKWVKFDLISLDNRKAYIVILR